MTYKYYVFVISITFIFFFNDTATTEIYTLSLHDALPICVHPDQQFTVCPGENGNGCHQISEQYECSHDGGNGYHSLTLGRELNSFCTGKSIFQKARQRAWNQDQAAKFMFLRNELLFEYEMIRDQVINW